MTTYSEKLRDPRWQRRRLEIMERAEFACEECGDDEATLHVHHCHYVRGRDPWEYEDESLRCLCADCHEIYGSIEAVLRYIVGTLPLNLQMMTIGYGYALRWFAGNYDIPEPLDEYLIGFVDCVGEGNATAFGIERISEDGKKREYRVDHAAFEQHRENMKDADRRIGERLRR